MEKNIMDKITEKEEFLLPGHTACPGCGSTIALRHVTKALGKDVVFVIPASCSSVYPGIYPHSAYNFMTFNTAFASAASVASGLKRGLEAKGNEDTEVVVWGGDGGIIDIGFASVSGAAERNEDILVFCYDNEAYMNTGIQRSGSTPPGAITTTTHTGKTEKKKMTPFILLEHDVPYVATANPAYITDLYKKIEKAKTIEGFRFIHILSPCPPGWRIPEEKSIEVAKIANKVGYWPLWEAEMKNEDLRFTLSPKSKKYLDPEERADLEEFYKYQGRFSKVTEAMKESLRKQIERQWTKIRRYL